MSKLWNSCRNKANQKIVLLTSRPSQVDDLVIETLPQSLQFNSTLEADTTYDPHVRLRSTNYSPGL